MSTPEYKEKLCETVLYYRKQNFKLVFYNDKCTKFDLYDAVGRKSYTYEFKGTLFTGIYAFPGPHGTYFVTRNSYLFVLKYPACRGFKPILLDNTIIRIRNPEKNVESVFYYGDHSFAYVRKVFNAKSQLHHYVCFHCNHETLVRSIAKSIPEKEDRIGKLQSLYSNEHVMCLTSQKKNDTKLSRVTFQIDPIKPYRQWYLANFSELPMTFNPRSKSEDGADPVFMDSKKELVIIQPGTSTCWKMNNEGRGVSSSAGEGEMAMTKVELPTDTHKRFAEKDLIANFSHSNTLYMTDKDGSVYKLNLTTLNIEPIDQDEDVASMEYVSKLCSSVFTNDRADPIQKSAVVSSLNAILDQPTPLSISSRSGSTNQPVARKVETHVETAVPSATWASAKRDEKPPINISIDKKKGESVAASAPAPTSADAAEKADAAALMAGVVAAAAEPASASASAEAEAKASAPDEDDGEPVACDDAALLIGVVAFSGLE